jgi:tRNA (guanine37-N1)-methyltransferase
MMRFSVVTLFPELFDSPLSVTLIGKARAAGVIAVDFVNPRDFTTDRHRTVDDAPYGGGHGMVMKPDPLIAAIESIAPDGPPPHRVLLTPAGAPLDQARVRALAARPHIALVCGRYEGIDDRVARLAIDEEISVGDFVLSGGELAALCVIDAVSRLVPGVLGELGSTEEESFSDGVSLEYPQYTRPLEFRGLAVPEVLVGGHHERVRIWRRREALRRTAQRRPELLSRRRLSPGDLSAAAGDPAMLPAARTYLVLAHHPVLDRTGAEVTSSVTNLDIHDIARSAATYGLAGYVPVTPIAIQREKIDHIIGVWREEMETTAVGAGRPTGSSGVIRNRVWEETVRAGHRGHALAPVEARASIEEAIAVIAARHGVPPVVVVTSARRVDGAPAVGYLELRRRMAEQTERPFVLLFGTGHGLAKRAIAGADCVLAPVEGQSDFNHLSVRSAAAIILDRLFGTGA